MNLLVKVKSSTYHHHHGVMDFLLAQSDEMTNFLIFLFVYYRYIRSTAEVTVYWHYVDAMLKHLKRMSSLLSSCSSMQTTAAGLYIYFAS